mgnify:CR=1 FL=1
MYGETSVPIHPIESVESNSVKFSFNCLLKAVFPASFPSSAYAFGFSGYALKYKRFFNAACASFNIEFIACAVIFYYANPV